MIVSKNFSGTPLRGMAISQGHIFRDLTVFMGGFAEQCSDIVCERFAILDTQGPGKTLGGISRSLIEKPERGVVLVAHPEAWAEPSELPEIADAAVRLILAGFEVVLFTHSSEILARLGVIMAASEMARKHPKLAKKVEKVVTKDLWLPKDHQVGAFFIDKGILTPMTDGNLIDGSPTSTVLEECFSQYRKLLGVK